MRKNWPYFIVASFLNAVLITGAFLEFKLRGIAVSELLPAPQTGWYELNPFVFSGGIFIISFLVIMAIVTIKDLVTGKPLQAASRKLHGIHLNAPTSASRNLEPETAQPFDVAELV